MFDKMIVSDANTAETGGRSRYFIVSGLIVGALFVSAVVLSIYAVNLDLGPDEFELSTMLAPVEPAEAERPREEPPRNQQSRQSDLPSRIQDMLRTDESPREIPNTVSVAPNQNMARPRGEFIIRSFDSVGTAAPDGTGNRTNSGGTTTGSYEAVIASAPVAETVPPPPPAVTKPKVPPVVSKGVINGTARSLPHPLYPPAAKLMGIEGAVSVQVTIDESGNVISARAVSGHPMLRKVSETAAAAAKFHPTTLSDVPVKVTGVIVYNFKR
ncbi:MAG: energy transducer TonB [Acidobacteria bacterium]|nr:energy transducer TonB [Acidobacteriota bacterium]